MKATFIGIAAVAILAQCSWVMSGSFDPDIIEYINEVITGSYLPQAKISKLGLTIVKNDGEMLFTKGYGYANEEKLIFNGNDTQFLIGSVTKSFTATVVVKTLNEMFPELEEAVLDTPIRTLVPSANFTLIDRFRSEYATFRDLLSHRMCLGRDDYQLLSEPFTSTSEIVYRQRYAKQICGMRSEFQYNNQMYVIAGELIGILANKSYLSLVETFLLELGMNNSMMVSQSDDFANMSFRAQPYYVMDNKSYPMNPDLIKSLAVSSAPGGLFVTPNDMARYMRFHLNKGNIDGRQIVPENVMKWLVKPSSSVNMMSYKASDEDPILNSFGYGTGLLLSAYDGWELIQHNGYFPPYLTQMSLFPEKNLAIFSSSSESPVLVDPVNLHAFIFETLRGTFNISERPKPNWNKHAMATLQKHKNRNISMEKHIKEISDATNNTIPQKADEIVGKYGSGVSGDAEVIEKFNNATNEMGLYVSYGKWTKGWLELAVVPIYKVFWDTDVVQDNYANGNPDSFSYMRIQNGTLEFLAGDDVNNIRPMATFQLGVSLDTLPPIPWLPDSCGPESS